MTPETQVAEMPKKKKAALPSYEVGSYRLQVRLPAAWRDAIERAAEKQGITASEFVREAVREKLPSRAQANLPDVSPGRPKSSGD